MTVAYRKSNRGIYFVNSGEFEPIDKHTICERAVFNDPKKINHARGDLQESLQKLNKFKHISQNCNYSKQKEPNFSE